MPMIIRSNAQSQTPDGALERARAYLARIPGAVSGQGGHNRTFQAVLHVGLGFGLNEEECLQLLLQEYNPRCDPPWSLRELKHKIESVYNSKLAVALWGSKLNDGRTSPRPRARPHGPPRRIERHDSTGAALPSGLPVIVVPSDLVAAIDHAAGGRAVAITRAKLGCEGTAIGLDCAPLVLVCDDGRLPSDHARRVTLPASGLRLREWLEEVLDEAELERLAPRIDPAVDPAEWRGLWSLVARREEERGRTPAEAARRATARVVAVYGVVARDEFEGLFPGPSLPVPRDVPWGWAEDGHSPPGDSGEGLRMNPVAVRSFLSAIVMPGEWFELRCLGCGESGATWAGAYPFHAIPTAIDDLAALDADPETRPRGAYVTMNPIKPPPRPVRLTKTGTATRDDGIARRRWVVLDFDPVRPNGVPSSEEELGLARRAAAIVAESLVVRGMPWPSLRVASGNGCHLWYRVDLPNDADSTKLVRRVLERAASLNPFANVEVDQRLTNASRIIRLAGMINRKGTPTPDRPWRMATAD